MKHGIYSEQDNFFALGYDIVTNSRPRRPDAFSFCVGSHSSMLLTRRPRISTPYFVYKVLDERWRISSCLLGILVCRTRPY